MPTDSCIIEEQALAYVSGRFLIEFILKKHLFGNTGAYFQADIEKNRS
jgi:hypothetical protein